MNIAPVSPGPVPAVTAPVAPQNNVAAQSNSSSQSNAESQAASASSGSGAPATAPASSSGPPAASVQELVQAASVPPSILQMAQGDGDGLTGVAALNDGDAAAQQAATAAKMG